MPKVKFQKTMPKFKKLTRKQNTPSNTNNNTPSIYTPSGEIKHVKINNKKYKLDALPSSIDSGALKYSSYFSYLSNVPVLPASIDLRDKLGPVRDQGSVGSCVGFGTSCMKEWQAVNSGDYTGYLSPAFIYLHRSNIGTEGMYPSEACDIIANIGVCTDNTF